MKTISLFRWVLCSVMAMGLIACGASNQEATETEETKSNLADEVMEIHDIAMAKMDAMHNLEVEIKDYLTTVDSTTAQNALATGQERITALSEASEAMMQWMRSYEPPSSEMPKAEATQYLNEQKAAIEKVNEQIDASLEDGKVFLESKK